MTLCAVGPNDDEDQQEKTLSQVYDGLPEGRTPLDILKNKEERQRIGKCQESRIWCLISESLFLILKISLLPLTGKAHIRRAIQGHEEALRIYSLCHSLDKLEVLHEILIASHQRSLKKYSENETEEEFTDYTEGPDINRESCFGFFCFFMRQ